MDSIPVGLVGVPGSMLSAALWEGVSPTSLCCCWNLAPSSEAIPSGRMKGEKRGTHGMQGR